MGIYMEFAECSLFTPRGEAAARSHEQGKEGVGSILQVRCSPAFFRFECVWLGAWVLDKSVLLSGLHPPAICSGLLRAAFVAVIKLSMHKIGPLPNPPALQYRRYVLCAGPCFGLVALVRFPQAGARR